MMKTFLAFLSRSALWLALRWLSLREGRLSGDVSPSLTVNCKFGPHLGFFARKGRWKSFGVTFTITPQSGDPSRLLPWSSGATSALSSVELQAGT